MNKSAFNFRWKSANIQNVFPYQLALGKFLNGARKVLTATEFFISAMAEANSEKCNSGQ